MAKIVTSGNLTGKKSKIVIEAKTSLKDFFNIRVTRIPEVEVMDGFKRAINRASGRIVTDLKIALDEAMKSGIWPTSSGSADIISSGDLMESGTVSVTNNGIIIAYSAPYAALVHYGGYITSYGNNTSSVYLPARPWVESVILGNGPVPAFNFEKYYRQEIEAEFSS